MAIPFRITLRTTAAVNFVFQVLAVIVSLRYIINSDKPETHLLISAIFVILFSLVLCKCLLEQIMFTRPNQPVLRIAFSAISLAFILILARTMTDFISEPKEYRETLILLGQGNIFILLTIGALWFVYSSIMQYSRIKAVEECCGTRGKVLSAFGGALMFSLLFSLFWFGYYRNPEYYFREIARNASKVSMKLNDDIVYTADSQTKVDALLDIFHLKASNSIIRGMCNCAGAPELEIQSSAGDIILEIRHGAYLSGLPLFGNNELTDQSKVALKHFTDGISANRSY